MKFKLIVAVGVTLAATSPFAIGAAYMKCKNTAPHHHWFACYDSPTGVYNGFRAYNYKTFANANNCIVNTELQKVDGCVAELLPPDIKPTE